MRLAGTMLPTYKSVRLIALAIVDLDGAPHGTVYVFSEQWGVLAGNTVAHSRALLGQQQVGIQRIPFFIGPKRLIPKAER